MSSRPLNVKCGECAHIWPAAYLPMEMTKLARLLLRAACPACASSQVFLAPLKKEEGHG